MSFSPINPFKLVLLYSRLTFNLPKLPYSFLPSGHLFNPITYYNIFFIWNHLTTRPSFLWITIGCGYHFSHFNPTLSQNYWKYPFLLTVSLLPSWFPSSDLSEIIFFFWNHHSSFRSQYSSSAIVIPPSYLSISLLQAWFLLQYSIFLFCHINSSCRSLYSSSATTIPPSDLNIPRLQLWFLLQYSVLLFFLPSWFLLQHTSILLQTSVFPFQHLALPFCTIKIPLTQT